MISYVPMVRKVTVYGSLKFFLQAFYESAKDATETIDKLTALHEKNIAVVNGLGRAAISANQVFAYLETNPIIEIRKTAQALGMAFNTISSAVSRLINAGILAQTNEISRNRTFAYTEYLEILRGGTE